MNLKLFSPSLPFSSSILEIKFQMQHFSGEIGFFFLSGDFYNLQSDTWTMFSKPEPAFNIFSIDNVPIILGIAALDNKCATGHRDHSDCHRRMLAGDNRVVQFNIQSNTWTKIGYLGRNNKQIIL